MLAYTGLETVANLAAETREPGRTLPRSLFVGIGAAVAISFLIAIVATSAYPAHPNPAGPGGYASDLGTVWLRAPLVGVAAAFGGELPAPVVDGLRDLRRHDRDADPDRRRDDVLLGCGKAGLFDGPLRHASARVRPAQPPDAHLARVDRLNGRGFRRRALIARGAGEPVRFLTSLYSFGVLIAFTAAQVAVVRLRFTEPELERPFRVPGNVRIRGTRCL